MDLCGRIPWPMICININRSISRRRCRLRSSSNNSYNNRPYDRPEDLMAVDAAASDLHVVATGAADLPVVSHLKSHDKSHSCPHGALLYLPKGKMRECNSLSVIHLTPKTDAPIYTTSHLLLFPLAEPHFRLLFLFRHRL